MKFKREEMIDNTQKLLFDMCENLEAISSKLDLILNNNTKQEIKDVKVETEKPKDEIEYKCNVCGKDFKNKQGLMAHSKVHKKESVKHGRTKPSTTSKR